MLPVTNISTYQFASLTDLKPLRERLLSLCKTWNLKGSILLSLEGINLFVAGARDKIDALIAELRTIPGLENLTPKISESDDQPFTRMLVKIKKEIISFGVEGIEPAKRTSPKLKAQELKKWLDEGRAVALLDTRNAYEIKLGTFENAIPIGIDHFRDFPDAVRKLPEEMKEMPIVMFCTGGIRCEKAGPFMEREGFKNIFQLDGGILKYFEEVGAAHYKGGCFVFDQRVGVDPSLQETQDKQCFICLAPVTRQDQIDPRYQLGKSCPSCFKTEEQVREETLLKRHEAVRRVTSPLPGSAPYDNYRPIKIPQKYDQFSLMSFLQEVFPHLPTSYWETEFASGHLLDNQKQKMAPAQIVRAGERYLHLLPATREPDVNAKIEILYEDQAIIVVNKPAPLPMHASGRFHRNTLQFILNEVYHPAIPRPAHRLDANTTGVVVLARSKHYAGLLQPQFAQGKVEKKYFARIQGHPLEDVFVCDWAIGADPIDVGARRVDENGLAALTHFQVIERHADGTSLVEARPLTGRTNQIRIHLWKAGFPICGDALYLPGEKLGTQQTNSVGETPLFLHAHAIKFTHPLTKKWVEFSVPISWSGALKNYLPFHLSSSVPTRDSGKRL